MTAEQNIRKRAGNARPYAMDFSSDMVFRSGTGKPIPYRVQAKLLHQFSTISRDAKRYGLFRSLDTGQAQKTYTYILKAPPKKRPLSQLR